MIRLELRTELRPARGATTPDFLRATIAALAEAGLDPSVRFSLIDAHGRKVSAVGRAIRRWPDLARFDHSRAVTWDRGRMERLLSNETDAPQAGVPAELDALLAILAGVPRSYPFFSATVRVTHPAFGEENTTVGGYRVLPGVVVEDHWGSTKRRVRWRATTVVEADRAAPSLPALPVSVRLVLDACGRDPRFDRLVLTEPDPETAKATAAIRDKTAALLEGIVERAQLPHDVKRDADRPPERPISSLKGGLTAAMRPLGYDCRGEGIGIIVCRHRSAAHVQTRLYMDLGTMRTSVDASWQAGWLGGSVTVGLPSYAYDGWEYLSRVFDESRWQQVCDNLAALVAELDRSVLPVIEATAGVTPAWYETDMFGYSSLRIPHPNGSSS